MVGRVPGLKEAPRRLISLSRRGRRQTRAAPAPYDRICARGTVAAIRDRVKGTSYEMARSVGVSEKDCDRIAGAFVYQGFDLEHFQPVDKN
jgi:hypothetical protein